MQIALYIFMTIAGIFCLAALLVYAAIREMEAIDRLDEPEPTEHGGRPL